MQNRFPNKVLPYLLLMPSVLIVVIFLIIPTVQSLYLSFYRVSPFGDRLIYVRLENFLQLLQSPDYLSSLRLTLIFASFVVVVGMSVSLGLAVLANQKIAGVGLYRTALIWPYALSPAVAGTIWALLFDPSSGAMTYFVGLVTGVMPNWMTDGRLALFIVCMAATWKMIGYNVIFFLAALQGIPVDVLEAAEIDGATPFQRFIRVSMAFLSPMAFFLLIMNSLYAFFEVFGLIDVMTKGGPGGSTEILVYKLYRDGFVNLRTGFASAESIILFIFVAVLTLLQFRFAGKKVFYQ